MSLEQHEEFVPATMTRRARLPADPATLFDELNKLHETTGLLLQCYQLYAEAYESLSQLHARGMDHFIVAMYQELQDAPLAPMPLQHLVMICHELKKGIVWLYTTANTIEHAAIAPPQEYLDELFASMKTEPFIPVVRSNGHKRGKKKGNVKDDEDD